MDAEEPNVSTKQVKGVAEPRSSAANGLATGLKMKRPQTKVSPSPSGSAGRRIGAAAPAAAKGAPPSSGVEDGLGHWLARNRGMLADVAPEILNEMEF